jgi:hypothetical protein
MVSTTEPKVVTGSTESKVPADGIAQGQAEAALPIAEKNIEAVGAVYEDFPNEEEINTLRRVAGNVPMRLYTIAFVELCERFSYYGTVIVVSATPPYFEIATSRTLTSYVVYVKSPESLQRPSRN